MDDSHNTTNLINYYYGIVTFPFARPKRKVTKSPAVRDAASIVAFNKFERQKRAPKSKRNDGISVALPVDFGS